MRYLMSFLAGLLVLFLAWTAGFDFNQRGFWAFSVSCYSLFAIGLVYTYPGWNRES